MINRRTPAASRFPVLLRAGLAVAAMGLAHAGGTGSTPSSHPEAGTYGTPDHLPQGTGTMGQPGYGGSGPAAGEGSAFEAAMAPQGWRIRVCSEKTKADQIKFTIGTGDKPKAGAKATGSAGGTGVGGSGSAGDAVSPDRTVTWTRGEATEMKLPLELRTAEKIRVEAVPGKKDEKASICVIYDDHVAMSMTFNDRETGTVKRTETAACGC